MNTVDKIWILVCDTKRYDIHTLFKESGSCLWNQRRNFEVGDIIFIYETKPVSKIIYKAIVEEINIQRDKPENDDNFYSRDFNKDYAFRMKCLAHNKGNRLQYNELYEKFGISGMKLMTIPQITDKNFIEFANDVFEGEIEDIPVPPTKEELYQPLQLGKIRDHIKHKMDFCEIRDLHLSKQIGISPSSIGRVRKGESIKSENVLSILEALGFAFIDDGTEGNIIEVDRVVSALRNKILSSSIRPTDIARKCNASISVISHLKNDEILPKLEVLENLLDYFGLRVVYKKMYENK